MKTKNDIGELLSLLQKSLAEHEYTDFDSGTIGKLKFLRVFKTKRKLGVRMLCAVAELPDNISTVSDFSVFFELLRNTLSKKYAKFPYFKELGTYFILLCNDKEYGLLKTQIKRYKDITGLHTNTMLGTIFINKNKSEFTDSITWGLIMTGKHFTTIRETVSDWIK